MEPITTTEKKKKKKKKKKENQPISVLCGKIREVNNIDCKAIKRRNGHPKWPGGAASVNESEHTQTHTLKGRGDSS